MLLPSLPAGALPATTDTASQPRGAQTSRPPDTVVAQVAKTEAETNSRQATEKPSAPPTELQMKINELLSERAEEIEDQQPAEHTPEPEAANAVGSGGEVPEEGLVKSTPKTPYDQQDPAATSAGNPEAQKRELGRL